MKIVTFGEIMLRLSKHSGQRLFQNGPFDAAYGGSEANVAVSLAQLGDDVEYVTRVPNNAIGDAALMHLRELGLNVRHTVRDAGGLKGAGGSQGARDARKLEKLRDRKER